MKKQELYASLEKIKPDEKLIRATLEKIEQQKEKQERKSSFFAVSYKLASAACALAIVVCVGIFAGKDAIISPVEDTPDTYSPSSFALNALPKEAEDEPFTADEPSDVKTDETEQAGAELLSRAAELSGDWQVIQGTIDGMYFVPNAADGEGDCLTAVKVERTIGSQGDSDLPISDGYISVSVNLDGDLSADELAQAMGARVCAILVATEQSGKPVWQITDILICD